MTINQFIKELKSIADLNWNMIPLHKRSGGEWVEEEDITMLRVCEDKGNFCPITAVARKLGHGARDVLAYTHMGDKLGLARKDTMAIAQSADMHGPYFDEVLLKRMQNAVGVSA